MKVITQHLGQIIAALAAICLLVCAVVGFKAPIGEFFNGIIGKETDIANDILNIHPGYDIVEGGYRTHMQGKALRFRSNAPFGKFVEVKVNGVTVDRANYEIAEGSTIVTFNEEYSATVLDGAHTIEVVSNDGTAKAPFAVKSLANARPGNIVELSPADTMRFITLPDDYWHTSTWVPMTWNVSVLGNYWSDGENIYCSTESESTSDNKQLVLNKETKTWEEKTWNGYKPDATWIWTDGTNIYCSDPDDGTYVLNKSTDTWEKKTWNGLTNISGDYVWRDGSKVYYSEGNNQYVLKGNTWEPISWNGLTNINGRYVWTDDTFVYYSKDANYYFLNGTTWELLDWAGNATAGMSTWSDGTYVYDSGTRYLNNGRWWGKTFTGGDTSFAGTCVWTDGEDIYYSYADRHYVLEKTEKPEENNRGDMYAITINGLDGYTITSERPNAMYADETVTLTFTANAGHTLPESIEVEGCTYQWTQSTGTLVLSNPTKGIKIVFTPEPTGIIDTWVNDTGKYWIVFNEDGTGHIRDAETEAAASTICTFTWVEDKDTITFNDVNRYDPLGSMLFRKTGTFNGLDIAIDRDYYSRA